MELIVHSSVHSMRFRILLVAALAVGLGLLTRLCSGMDGGMCCSSQFKMNNCNIQTSRIPLNPCPIIPTTSCSAPVKAYALGETPYFGGTRLKAPLSKPSCISAPVTKGSLNSRLYAGRSDKSAPYFAAKQCPTAPVFISDPTLQTRNHYK